MIEANRGPSGGPYQYYAVHQYSVVCRVWGASGVYKFLTFAPPTPPQNLIAGILSAHVRCIALIDSDCCLSDCNPTLLGRIEKYELAVSVPECCR